MKPRTAKSMELYDILLRRGYPEPFCDEITKNLNTDWTAQRMILINLKLLINQRFTFIYKLKCEEIFFIFKQEL